MNRIKRLSTEILDEYKDKFGTDFSTNKQSLNEVSIIRSKGLKNEIAGYITKILKRQQKFEDRKQQLIEDDKKLDENEPTPEPTPESESDDPFEGIETDDINQYADLFDVAPPENDSEAKNLAKKIKNWISNGRPKP